MSWTLRQCNHVIVQVLLWFLKRREGTTMLHRGHQTRCCDHNRRDDRRPFRKLSTMFRWGGKGWQVTFNLMVKDNLNNLSLWCLRFFFATQGIEDMNDLPCCNRKERRRLANATECGQKPYHNRILGGIVSKVGEGGVNLVWWSFVKEHEFPWHCALLKKDGSFHGCGAVLLRFLWLPLLSAIHDFQITFAAVNQKSSLPLQLTVSWGKVLMWLFEIELWTSTYRESNPENILVSCGAHHVSADAPSPLDPDEVRLQATEVLHNYPSKWNLNFSEKVLRHEDFRWLTAHSPILGENNGHPSGLGLFENDIAVIKVNGTLPCKRKEIWPACLPTPVSIQ